MSNQTNHKSILKSTSIFGFVQVLRMVIKIITGKFIALFLGPSGFGLISLLENTIALITSVTSLGINTTGVREIALANDDDKKTARIIAILNKWSIIVGIFGALISIVFSGLLSKLVFGTSSNFHYFILLSICFLFSAFSASRAAILQGKRKLKLIVTSNVVSSLLITILSLLIYYFLRVDGIIYVLITSSLILFLVNMYFTRNITLEKVKLSYSEAFTEGKGLIKLGLLLSINVIFGQICFYIIRLYLNYTDQSSELLGFYEVSNVLLVSYLGLVFTAMANDYYPSLTTKINKKEEYSNLVNDQIEIALLLVTPAVLFLYVTDDYIIQFLYSKDFLPVTQILKMALFGIIVRAIIWPLGFIALAKGDNKEYFRQNIMSDAMNIIFTIVLYDLFKLEGIGMASTLTSVLFIFYIVYLVQKKYQFQFRANTVKLIVISLILGSTALVVKLLFPSTLVIFVIIPLFLISGIYSLFVLNKKLKLFKK